MTADTGEAAANDLALRPFTVLSMCSGIGGLDLGISLATSHASRTIAYIEREGYCASLLQARMAAGHIDDAPIWSDLKSFDAGPWRGKVDCITAGYPCQPFSAAGKKRGKEDPRHLWPYICEHVAAIEPAFVFCENVTGHLTLGFEQVCEDLSGMGYRIEAGVFSAEECGALHRRERLFFLAHAESSTEIMANPASTRRPQGQRGVDGQIVGERRLPKLVRQDFDLADADGSGLSQRQSIGGYPCAQQPSLERGGAEVADAHSLRQLQQVGFVAKKHRRFKHNGHQDRAGAIKPGVVLPVDGFSSLVDHAARGWPSDWEDGTPRTGDNIPHRTDRLRALGNAVVPIVAAKAWATLSQQAMAQYG